jgi:5-methyltetrahydropteroyltriglutamate--homocysteine methyltransferase
MLRAQVSPIKPMSSLGQLRVDNVGSLLRPESLKRAFSRHRVGKVTDADLTKAQDEAIRRAIRLLVDGEFRRTQFMESFAVVEGFSDWSERMAAAREARSLASGGSGVTAGPSALSTTKATQRLQLARNRPLDEYKFTSALTNRPVKATLIGPDRIFQSFDVEGSRAVYPDPWLFLDDVAKVERRMVGQLVDAGCPYVHMDAPGFTAYVDEASLERIRSRGLDPSEVLERTIRAENEVIEGFGDTTFGIHLCRGNERGRWHREGAYDAVAEQLFAGLRLLLEYDTERAGSFAPLRFVPKGKTVVLGLVSTKSPRLETVDELCRRIDDASRYIPLDQLAISPQCGFASGIEGNPVTHRDQWRKLDRVMETARRVWN